MSASTSLVPSPSRSPVPVVQVPAVLGGPVPQARWTTPRRLRLGAALIVAATVLFLLQAMAMVGRSRATLHTVQKDTAPSIIAAQTIHAGLADLDANAANELLGNPTQRDVAHRVFEQRRIEVTAAIVKAAENITFGDAERAPVLQLVEHLGHFLELQSDARTKRDLALGPQAIGAYRAAHEEMQVTLGAAQELDRVNGRQLEDAYATQRRSEGSAQTLAVVCGVLLIGSLLWLQLYIARRMRRILNLPLLAATVLGFFAIATVLRSFAASQDDLRLAKEDAFDSVHLLWQARAIAYEANGDESRFLLDAPKNQQDELSFHSSVDSLQTDLFPREMANVTFDGELAAAKIMVAKFQDYLRVDDRIRDRERAGKHDDAVELCIGTQPTESNAVFALFDGALDMTLGINMRAFDQQTAESDAALARVLVVIPVLAVLIIALALLGVRPRLREYAV